MKVGKAIYNILSKSTDVQSNFPFNTTDYAPTGTELVTNGDFSAAGINLVSNPNFTDGVEKIVDGDFPYPNTAWSLNTGVTVPSAGILDFDGTGGAYASQDILTSGKSYKVSIAVATTSLEALNVFLGGGNSIYSSVVDADTTIVIYGVSGGSNDLLYIGDWEGTITSVSVKELGADWTLGTGWSIGDSKAICLADGGYEVLNQLSVLNSGSSYKVTYTADLSLITSGSLKLNTFSNSVTDRTVLDGTNTVYLTANGTSFQVNMGGAFGTATITNILIQELGEGWTVGDKWSLSDAGARLVSDNSDASGLSQSNVFEIGKSYKVTLDAVVNSGIAKLEKAAGLTQFEIDETKTYVEYFVATRIDFYLNRVSTISDIYINNITVQEMILTKIFPELAPPDIDAPYVVYSVVSNSPSETKNANGDIDTANVEVYGFQDTYNKAVDLGVSVRAALDRKTGTYNTIEIQSTNYVGEQMDVNEARKLWAAIQDYSIRIKNI